MAMEKTVYEELDEVKVENVKLRADFKGKAELCEQLKKVQNEQVMKIQDASSLIEKQARQLSEKEEQLSVVTQANEDLISCLNEKESVIKHLQAANDKLRVERDEKNKTWEQENRRLVLDLDESNEKNIDQEKKIDVLKVEIEGLKAQLSVSQKKCLEAEENAKKQKELNDRDDLLVKAEEGKREVEDQLKWKKEQFKHLEEAHDKLREQFKVSKKEWEQEKSRLVEDICSLQMRLDSEVRIKEDVQNRLQMCNQALAHEETRRKYLEVEITESKTHFESIFAECEDAKSQLDCLTSQRDDEVATLRHLLGTKESYCKEMEYQAGKLEQENQELVTSLKQLQEARTSSSSLSKLKNKLKSVEQMHKECSANLRAKEAEWNSQLDEMTRKINNYSSQLKSKDAALKVLEMELEANLSSAVQLKLQNEELSVILLLLKSGMSEAQLKLANVKKEMVENSSIQRQQGEMKSMALAIAQKDIVEESEKRTAILSRRVDALDKEEEKNQLMHKELNRCQKRLEEASRSQMHLEEKLRQICDALEAANSELTEEKKTTASLIKRVDSLEHIEQKWFQTQKELERYKKMLEEASRRQQQLDEQTVNMKDEFEEKLGQVLDALQTANFELAEERERAASLLKRIESLDQLEEQQASTQKDLKRYKEMLEESSRCQLHLKQQICQIESNYKRKLTQVSNALDKSNSELVKKICEGHEIEFELWIWKSIAERLKTDLEESHELRKELEASLLAQVDVAETIKQEKDELIHHIAEEKEGRIVNLQQQIVSLEQEIRTRELEAVSCTEERILQITIEHEKIFKDLQKEIGLLEEESLRRELESVAFANMGAERKYEHEKDNFLQLIEEKDQRIEVLMQAVKSMEDDLNSSLNSFSSELAEKQAQIIFVHEAWEKIARAEILATLEVEEKKLMIVELEDDIQHIQEKLLLQEKSLSDSKQVALTVEAELEAKHLEMKNLADQMEARLITSEALVDELKGEKTDLLEDIMNLSMERENLLGFIEGLGNRITELSAEDAQLMGILGRMVQSFDYTSDMKENKNTLLSPATKNPPLSSYNEERPPFRQLN